MSGFSGMHEGPLVQGEGECDPFMDRVGGQEQRIKASQSSPCGA